MGSLVPWWSTEDFGVQIQSGPDQVSSPLGGGDTSVTLSGTVRRCRQEIVS